MLEIRDRDNTEGKPIAWLLIERQETYLRDPSDNSIYEASICLYYQRILPKNEHYTAVGGNFSGGYRKRGFSSRIESVSLSSSLMERGAIFLDLTGLEGQRIGTYLMNEIVTWVQRWPEATVGPIRLLHGQSQEENKARRNWFYEQFGLVFDYDDPAHSEGISKPIQVKSLTPVDRWKENIREHNVLEYLGDVILAEQQASTELEHRDRAIKSLREEIKKAKDKPLRWACQIIWWRNLGFLIAGIIIAGIVVLGWLRLKVHPTTSKALSL